MRSTKKHPYGYELYESTIFEDFRVMVENVAKKYPDDIAFSYKNDPNDRETVKITYAQSRTDIHELGTGLLDLGCRGKTCAITGVASIGWIYSYIALTATGAITVPLDKEWNAEDLASTVAKAECEYLFYSEEVKGKLEIIAAANPQIKKYICIKGEPREGDIMLESISGRGRELIAAGNNDYYDLPLDPDALATIVFTSGTTGKGKGVMLTQTNICKDMTGGMYLFNVTKKTLCLLPLHHTYASTGNIIGHYSQGSEVYISSGLKYIMREMKEQQPSHLVLVPLFLETFYKKIWATARQNGQDEKLKKGIKLSNNLRKFGIDRRRSLFRQVLAPFGGKFELVVCGGAPLNQKIIDFFDAIGITVVNGYGITECAPFISCNRNRWRKPNSVGVPFQGESVRIYNPNEKGEGEICVKGPNVMLGYFKDEEATKVVFDSDGYFHTGDFGRMDSEGWLYITGRMKNIIVLSNGKNVYPEEIENDISRIPGVSEIIVHEGVNKLGKQVLVAQIFPDADYLRSAGVLPEGYKAYFEKEIFDKLNPSMPPYKHIKYVKIRDNEFAKNTSRKITRFNVDKKIDG